MDNFYEKLYSRFPKIYTDEDSAIGNPLKRYLKSLDEGGFSVVIKDIEDLLNIIDLKKGGRLSAEKQLSLFSSQYGIDFIRGLGEDLSRHFLSEIPEIIKYRGSDKLIPYLISILTGLYPNVTYFENQNNGIDVDILAYYYDKDKNSLPKEDELAMFIKNNFLPFYVNVNVTYKKAGEMTLGELVSKGFADSVEVINYTPVFSYNRGTEVSSYQEDHKSIMIKFNLDKLDGLSKIGIQGLKYTTFSTFASSSSSDRSYVTTSMSRDWEASGYRERNKCYGNIFKKETPPDWRKYYYIVPRPSNNMGFNFTFVRSVIKSISEPPFITTIDNESNFNNRVSSSTVFSPSKVLALGKYSGGYEYFTTQNKNVFLIPTSSVPIPIPGSSPTISSKQWAKDVLTHVTGASFLASDTESSFYLDEKEVKVSDLVKFPLMVIPLYNYIDEQEALNSIIFNPKE